MKSSNIISGDLPVIGILGDGQLAAMMAEAYQELGGVAAVFCSTHDSPAAMVAQRVMVADDADNTLENFFQSVDIMTLENEFHSARELLALQEKTGTSVLPDPSSYLKIEDKLSENKLYDALNIPVAEYWVVHTGEDLIDQPGYLKLTKGGYDGKGTYRVESRAEAQDIFARIQASGEVIFEREIKHSKELSLVVAAQGQDMVFYPLVETHQEHGTCRYVDFPAQVSEQVEREAREIVTRLMQKLDTAGVFAFELFLDQDGTVLLNESAPRPHNSGHITLDSMNCSQFENHMRAVAGLELVEPQAVRDSMVMVNLLATRDAEFDAKAVIAEIGQQDLTVKLYDKKHSRKMRKMGHINIWGDDKWSRARDLVERLDF